MSSLIIKAHKKKALKTQNKQGGKKKLLTKHIQRKIKNLFLANCHPTKGFEMSEFSPSV